ncbi:MAG: hypothetical protein TR69_WS6001000184 [candidate division WS6 bacterium OLB20]|uniref:Uncharacterized protein n=1 Tax=candidate division WS6 bacterium OLB20 TaxID=1617426 RepID=A0A136M079_9BACT|nr:MAG: hypothetical protein TR69_WS6001000184 [candidate division WS6 bacterium OLB20]
MSGEFNLPELESAHAAGRGELLGRIVERVRRHIANEHDREQLRPRKLLGLMTKFAMEVGNMVKPIDRGPIVSGGTLVQDDNFVVYQLYRKAQEGDTRDYRAAGALTYFPAGLNLRIEPFLKRTQSIESYVRQRAVNHPGTVACIDGPTFRLRQLGQILEDHPGYASYLMSRHPLATEAEVPSDWLMINGQEMVPMHGSEGHQRGAIYQPRSGAAVILSEHEAVAMKDAGELREGIVLGTPGFLTLTTDSDELASISVALNGRIQNYSAFAELYGDNDTLYGYIYLNLQRLTLEEFHSVLSGYADCILEQQGTKDKTMRAVLLELEDSMAIVIKDGKPVKAGQDPESSSHTRNFHLILEHSGS